MSRKRAGKPLIRRARELHLYLGTFFAPAILFFAFTGGLQTFSFHESHPGDTYRPPEWIRVLAQLHKKQTTVMPAPRPEQNARKGIGKQAAAAKAPPARADGFAVLAFKWFVLAMSLGLLTTTGLGVYMAFKFNPGRRLIWFLLVLGTVVPAGLVLLPH